MRIDRRAPHVAALLLLGVLSGLAMPALEGCANDDCTQPEPAYRFASALGPWVLETSKIEVSDSHITVTYTTTDGSTWEVVYRRSGD